MKSTELLKQLLEEYGFDLADPDFTRTPERMDKMFREVMSSHWLDLDREAENIFATRFPTEYNGLVVIGPINFVSFCPHHVLPVIGKVWVGTLPGTEVAGLSKFARLVHLLAKRPLKQEDFTYQLVKQIDRNLSPKGTMVVVKANHSCMSLRGVKTPEAVTTTSSLSGIFQTDEGLKTEFMSFIK